MGNEADVTARFKGKTASGKARLETAVLLFRGKRLSVSRPLVNDIAAACLSGAGIFWVVSRL